MVVRASPDLEAVGGVLPLDFLSFQIEILLLISVILADGVFNWLLFGVC